nr:MAG: hypothetical protein TU35_04645 [Thermoproteus sp. AZ2]
MKSYAAVAFLVVVWGLAYPLTKLLSQFFSPPFIAFFRALVGFLMLYAAARGLRPGLRTAIVGILSMGATVLSLSIATAISRNPGLVSALMYTQPIFVLAIGAALGARPKPLETLGVALGVSGVVLSAWGGLSLDVALPLIGGFLWALGSILYGRWLASEDPMPVTAAMNGYAALFLAPAAALDFRIDPTPISLALLIALAVAAQGLGWLLYFVSIRELGVAKVSEMVLLTPVSSYLFSYAIFRAVPTEAQLAGSALILLGVFLTYLAKPRPARPREAAR